MAISTDSKEYNVVVMGTKFTITVDYYKTKAGTVLVDQITDVFCEENLIDVLPEKYLLMMIEAVPGQ
jgi:hypothetical protein